MQRILELMEDLKVAGNLLRMHQLIEVGVELFAMHPVEINAIWH